MVSDQPGRQEAVRPGLLDEAPKRSFVQREATEPAQLGHRQGEVHHRHHLLQQGLAPDLREADSFKSKLHCFSTEKISFPPEMMIFPF